MPMRFYGLQIPCRSTQFKIVKIVMPGPRYQHRPQYQLSIRESTIHFG